MGEWPWRTDGDVEVQRIHAIRLQHTQVYIGNVAQRKSASVIEGWVGGSNPSIATTNHNQSNNNKMKAIIEKETVTEKIMGNVAVDKDGKKVIDCIGIDKITVTIRFLSIPVYRKTTILNQHQA